MKKVMFDDMYCWSVFNDVRQIDFNGHLWVREGGNVLIDPVPMSDGDLEQFDALGGAKWIVVTNRDHEREADFFKQRTGAVVVGAPVGKFSLLMDEKLQDPPKAALGLRKLLALDFDAVLVGDGHSIMTGARAALLECLEERSDIYINKINIADIPWMQGGRSEGYDCEVKDIDPLIGAQTLGYQIIRLGKGQSICPLHFHHFGEEMFYVVEGSCTMVTPRGKWPVQEGDCIAFPTGPRGAHKFRNDGDEGCQLLALGEHVDHEVAEYPDSGKINVVAKRDTGQVIYRMEDSVNYWEGE